MKNIFLLCLLFQVPMLFAQDKTFSLNDATGLNPSLYPKNLGQLGWMGESETMVWVSDTSLVRMDAKTMQPDTIRILFRINSALTASGEEPLKRLPSFRFMTTDEMTFTVNRKIGAYHLTTGNLSFLNQYPAGAENIDTEYKTFKTAYTSGNSLYIASAGTEICVEKSDSPGIVYGSNRVHRNEWGIEKGTFWSPAGNFLAFYRMDESPVTDYPLVDISGRIATAEPVKYPMAGMTSHSVKVGVFDTRKHAVIYLETGAGNDPDSLRNTEYLTNVTWSPDERHIYIATLNRDQNFMRLNKYDALTGAFISTLFTETDSAYVEPMQGPVFIHNDPSRFIWQSQRDGYNHLYLYDSEGNLIHQLTHGKWVVTSLVGPDATGTRMFFMCNKDNPLDRYLYYADLKKHTLHPLIVVPGTHQVKASFSGRYFIDSYSSIETAREIRLVDEKSRTLRVLLENQNPLNGYKLGETSVFTIPGENQEDLYCRMIKPPDFDPGKKYPVIIYVYGGPHSQLITNTWMAGAGFYLNFLAQQGYLVFTLDNRGTAGRGLAFEQAIFRNLGKAETADQMRGVAYLRSLPYVDSTRIGINGWSYGGFMTISLLVDHPGIFKAAVAGGPVIDWQYYEVMYGERYMDTPGSNPVGYRESSLLHKAGRINGRLLIIHGYQDGTVVPQNSLTFLKKCVDEGKQVDFFLYPGHEHNVRGKDRAHLNQKILQYFNDFL